MEMLMPRIKTAEIPQTIKSALADVRSHLPATPGRAVGALAVGALALAAFAAGAVVIGRLTIGRARIRRLEIDELLVRKIRLTDGLEAARQPAK
jgi:hypothetical protein